MIILPREGYRAPCPKCDPGDTPEVRPLYVHTDGQGGECAHYCCPVRALHRWRTAWPVTRSERAA